MIDLIKKLDEGFKSIFSHKELGANDRIKMCPKCEKIPVFPLDNISVCFSCLSKESK